MAEYDGEGRPGRKGNLAAADRRIEPMMTVADIARRLALSEDHVRERLVTRADFPAPAFQIGRTRRWERAQVEQWIRARSASKSRRRSDHRA